MKENVVENYGWKSENAPQSCDWIGPAIIALVHGLGLKRVLDLGAGNGALCGIIAKLGIEVVGVEYDANGCELARSMHPGIRFYNFGVQDDPRTLLSTEAAFDAVVSTEVIEHLFLPRLLPRYAHQTLRAGGYLILSTPYHGFLKNMALSIFDGWDRHHTPLWDGGHIKFWSRKTLGQLLEECGFRVTGFQGVGRIPYLWKSMILVAQKV